MSTRRRVLVTHADEPLGRSLAQRLMEDPSVERLDTVGPPGAEPPFEHRFAHAPARFEHHEADLAKARDVAELFAKTEPDAVLLLPRRSNRDVLGRPWLADVPPRTVETRLILQQCLEHAAVRQLVALGSMAAYALASGNANRLDEHAPLALAPDCPAAVRSWVDCDMMIHAEVHHPTLCVALLRLATVLTCEGELLLAPCDAGPLPLRALGYDPMCPLVVDHDVVQATMHALHLGARGVFNVAGDQCVPLSVLDRARGAQPLPVPAPLLSLLGHGLERLGRGLERLGGGPVAHRVDTPHQRYGASLDTTRARTELGFEPAWRVDLNASGSGSPTLEARPV